jgi:hypothetical protein
MVFGTLGLRVPAQRISRHKAYCPSRSRQNATTTAIFVWLREWNEERPGGDGPLGRRGSRSWCRDRPARRRGRVALARLAHTRSCHGISRARNQLGGVFEDAFAGGTSLRCRHRLASQEPGRRAPRRCFPRSGGPVCPRFSARRAAPASWSFQSPRVDLILRGLFSVARALMRPSRNASASSRVSNSARIFRV